MTTAAIPKSEFGAVMVCSEADKSCPVVDGADIRVAMPYDDPKYFDGTPSQDLKYDERCKQIARDMFFVMDYVKTKLVLLSETKR
jgi:arsenate reductase (thioredoxin)